jgi:hypothetical protein
VARKSKCHECNIVDEQEKVVDEENPKKRYHVTCLGIARKRKEFLKKEKEQKDELVKYIMEVHDLRNSQEIPPLFYIKLEEIRNDSKYLGHIHKNYKRGVNYQAIKKTYEFCRKKIEEIIRSMTFETKLSEMSYVLAVVKNSFVDAYNYAVHVQKQKESINNETKIDNERNFTYKKKETQHDISQFL